MYNFCIYRIRDDIINNIQLQTIPVYNIIKYTSSASSTTVVVVVIIIINKTTSNIIHSTLEWHDLFCIFIIKRLTSSKLLIIPFLYFYSYNISVLYCCCAVFSLHVRTIFIVYLFYILYNASYPYIRRVHRPIQTKYNNK